MKPQRSTLSALALLGSLIATAHAADHRDGPLATNDPAADLNDVYLFMNPNDPSELILAGTVVPLANSNSRFSDVVEYKFHLDNGTTTGKSTITCTFPSDATRVLCRDGGGTLNAEGGLNRTLTNGDLRLWAGLRDDPFFFDLVAFNNTRAAIAPRFTNPGANFFGQLNTLAIVMGIKRNRVTNNGANPILKVYSSTNRIGDAGIGAGISGMWFDAANPGHGVIMQVLDGGADPAPDKLVAYWNVFDNSGNQLNVFGLGDIAPNGTTVSVPVSSGSGGRFPPAFMSSQVTQTPFGTLAFSFSNCNTGSMAVTPTRSGFSPVTIPLTRLSNVVDLPCTFLSAGQIDRNGRPAINTALIDLLASTGKKDAYNRAVDPAGWAAAFQSEMQANLTALDTLDGITGNAVLPAATLAAVLVDDRMQINTSIAACDAYLAVELGVAGQCGGRTLRRDVIDDTLGATVGPGVRDNVADDSTYLADFPFMGPPR